MTTEPVPFKPSDTLTAAQVAQILRISPNSVYKGARAGEIPHIKIGNVLRFSAQRINALINGESA